MHKPRREGDRGRRSTPPNSSRAGSRHSKLTLPKTSAPGITQTCPVMEQQSSNLKAYAPHRGSPPPCTLDKVLYYLFYLYLTNKCLSSCWACVSAFPLCRNFTHKLEGTLFSLTIL